MIRVYATPAGVVLGRAGLHVLADAACTLDGFFTAADPQAFAAHAFSIGRPVPPPVEIAAPLGRQEVWAAGVTYQRSKTARMEESKVAGGGSFYDRVYAADRPELFFKASPHRVVAPGGQVKIRSDSQWNVPEPELTLAVSSAGVIFGYTIGNDMSSRDIEGENPLYLPQAKVYAGCAALGPALIVDPALPGPETRIELNILRGSTLAFAGTTSISHIRRPLPSLVDWLWRANSFPAGCYLMTGTGIVPPDSFTLQRGDEIRITIEPVGTLINFVG